VSFSPSYTCSMPPQLPLYIHDERCPATYLCLSYFTIAMPVDNRLPTPAPPSIQTSTDGSGNGEAIHEVCFGTIDHPRHLSDGGRDAWMTVTGAYVTLPIHLLLDSFNSSWLIQFCTYGYARYDRLSSITIEKLKVNQGIFPRLVFIKISIPENFWYTTPLRISGMWGCYRIS
jgi:hypothetical protein